MNRPPPRERFVVLLDEVVRAGTLVKLTLSRPKGGEATPRKVLVRPIQLKAGPRLSFVFRHATRDVTQNFLPDEGLARIRELLEKDFFQAHLFATTGDATLEEAPGRPLRFTQSAATHRVLASQSHDRARQLAVPAETAWLQALGVTTDGGRVCAGMEGKFRQINRYVELLGHLLAQCPAARKPGLRLLDLGCGKGYLTFAAWDWLRREHALEAAVTGVEARPELVTLANRIAKAGGCTGLEFHAGTIADTAAEGVDVVVALHACDTATDDALALGVKAQAALLLAAPCCHKELRPRLQPPAALAGALRHGILLERHAEWVTDALRAGLLEWAGYETSVLEFISPEHTAKNLMIAAIRRGPAGSPKAAEQVRRLAGLHGIQSQRLAEQLGFALNELPAG